MSRNLIIVNHATRQIKTLMKIVDKLTDKYEPLMKIAYKREAFIKLAHQGIINQYKEQASKSYRKFEKKIGLSMRYKDEDGKFYFLIYNFLWDLYRPLR